MNRRQNQEFFRRFGPPEAWVLSVDEIEKVITTATCRHLLPRIDDCRECFPAALLRRQMTLLAERVGCSPEDALAVSKTLCDQYLEQPT